MKFIWRYVWRKMRDIGNEPDTLESPKVMGAKYATVSAAQDHDWPDGLNVRIHTAMGGKIVSFNRYDRKKIGRAHV